MQLNRESRKNIPRKITNFSPNESVDQTTEGHITNPADRHTLQTKATWIWEVLLSFSLICLYELFIESKASSEERYIVSQLCVVSVNGFQAKEISPLCPRKRLHLEFISNWLVSIDYNLTCSECNNASWTRIIEKDQVSADLIGSVSYTKQVSLNTD